MKDRYENLYWTPDRLVDESDRQNLANCIKLLQWLNTQDWYSPHLGEVQHYVDNHILNHDKK